MPTVQQQMILLLPEKECLVKSKQAHRLAAKEAFYAQPPMDSASNTVLHIIIVVASGHTPQRIIRAQDL